ncbi:urease accessory protein UreF [Opitutaceae bacterium EW11]|nr:urease accessory protein UreF [Opitutaceae bacterium EW11]
MDPARPNSADSPLHEGSLISSAFQPFPVWLTALLQLNDTFYPTGAYAHSYGLEGLIAEGVVRDRDTLERFLNVSVVPGLRQLELPLVAHAWEGLHCGDWERLARLSVLASASRTPKEARAASEAIGRQRIELCARLRNAPLAVEFLRRAERGAWPFSAGIAAAVEARVLGAPVEAALSSVFYAAVAGTIAAAMKLLRLGQNGAQSLLTAMLALAPETMSQALHVSEAEIGWFNPWLDVAAARHETADARLFIS